MCVFITTTFGIIFAIQFVVAVLVLLFAPNIFNIVSLTTDNSLLYFGSLRGLMAAFRIPQFVAQAEKVSKRFLASQVIKFAQAAA